MSFYAPSDLLRLWQQEQLTAEQALGHVLQILQAQQQMLQAQQQRLRDLEQQFAAQVEAVNQLAETQRAPPETRRRRKK
ncbi:MAG: hypothetical protein ACLFVO_09335 [Chloroflexaceae bacterium]|jgi:prefoldin subunit 5